VRDPGSIREAHSRLAPFGCTIDRVLDVSALDARVHAAQENCHREDHELHGGVASHRFPAKREENGSISTPENSNSHPYLFSSCSIK
jgi:hypothetical protein